MWMWILLLVVAIAAYVLSKPAMPTRYRGRPLQFVDGMVHRLSVMSERSFLIVQHEGSPRFFQFRKAPDEGTPSQQIVFDFPFAEWSAPYFDALLHSLTNAGFEPKVEHERNAEARTRIIEVRLRGLPAEVSLNAYALLKVVAPAVGLSDSDRFSFHVEGSPDLMIWRRVNADHFRRVAQLDRSRSARFFARRQLKKLRDQSGG